MKPQPRTAQVYKESGQDTKIDGTEIEISAQKTNGTTGDYLGGANTFSADDVGEWTGASGKDGFVLSAHIGETQSVTFNADFACDGEATTYNLPADVTPGKYKVVVYAYYTYKYNDWNLATSNEYSLIIQ